MSCHNSPNSEHHSEFSRGRERTGFWKGIPVLCLRHLQIVTFITTNLPQQGVSYIQEIEYLNIKTLMEIENDRYKITSEILSALAHPARLQILDLLRDGEQCVCHMQAMSGQRQAFISQHLNKLKRVGLVTSRKDGHMVFYQAVDDRIFKWIDGLKIFVTHGETLPEQQARGAGKAKKQPCSCPKCTAKREIQIGQADEPNFMDR